MRSSHLQGSQKSSGNNLRRNILTAVIATSLFSVSAIAADHKMIESAKSPSVKPPQAKYLASPDAAKVIPGQYIVVFKDAERMTRANRELYVSDKAAQLNVDLGAKVLHQYAASIAGVAVKLNPDNLGRLLADPEAVSYTHLTLPTR